MVVLSSFVMAGSEISANFVIGETKVETGNYIPNGNFWNSYGIYMIGILVVLVIGYFFLKMKSGSVFKIKSRKKISRKRAKKKI